jgi:hypothetical protein
MSNELINDNKELARQITSIVKKLGNPVSVNKNKGGAPDDGLATLIVTVLKALSNDQAATATSPGAGAGAGASAGTGTGTGTGAGAGSYC